MMDGILQRVALFWFQFTFCAQLWILLFVYFCLMYSVYTRTLAAVYLVYFVLRALGPGQKDVIAAPGCVKWPMWLKNWSLWRHMAAYFPARLVRTKELDPTKNYIFVLQPHGLCAISGWINFATNATGFDRLFPGIHVHCVTLHSNFKVPFLREYILLHGLRSASKTSLVNILTQGPGSSVLLATGGASESLLSAPHTYDTLVGKRKGFVEVALLSGASIVPVVAFGETNTFDTYIPPEHSMIKRVMKTIKSTCGFATPIFWGSNTFGGANGKSTPLNTVCGAPIDVPNLGFTEKDRESVPFQRLVAEIHTRYCKALLALWDAYKELYARDRVREMQLIKD